MNNEITIATLDVWTDFCHSNIPLLWEAYVKDEDYLHWVTFDKHNVHLEFNSATVLINMSDFLQIYNNAHSNTENVTN